MNTTDLVQFPVADAPQHFETSRPGLAPSRYELASPARCGILRARQQLLGQQRFDGSWSGRKSCDVAALSRFVLLEAFFDRAPTAGGEQIAAMILRAQHAAGGWAPTSRGAVDLDTSVLAYFALKAAGLDACDPEVARARRAIRASGGADAASMTTRLWLALLGQLDYDFCSPLVPEWLLTPSSCGGLSARDEQWFAALSVVWSLRPVHTLDLAHGVRELFVEPPRTWSKAGGYSCQQASAGVAGFWACYDRLGIVPLRKRALERAGFVLAEAAAEAPLDDSSFEQLAWQRVALAALGFDASSPVVMGCDQRLERLITLDGGDDEVRSQPETSLTSDTALAIEALRTSGVPAERPAVAAGIKWLVDHRVEPIRQCNNIREMAATWRAILHLIESDRPADQFLPPDLRMVAPRLRRFGRRWRGATALPSEFRGIADELCKDILFRQRFDGGWSPWSGPEATRRGLRLRRFAAGRSGEISSPEATGATLELLHSHGLTAADPAVQRAVSFLLAAQRGDGSWDSMTGARYLHGTTWAIRGLLAGGLSPCDSAVAAGVNWLAIHQQENGGWGESVDGTNASAEYVAAEPTAIQTAWAVLALALAGRADHDATLRGVACLLDEQQSDGSWHDLEHTVRDSPAGNWYRNELHSTALPLLALSRWAVAIGELAPESEPRQLRLVLE